LFLEFAGPGSAEDEAQSRNLIANRTCIGDKALDALASTEQSSVNFADALARMQAGSDVARWSWVVGDTVCIRADASHPPRFLCDKNDGPSLAWSADLDDLLAEDWYVSADIEGAAEQA
jgi:hypothetical protein